MLPLGDSGARLGRGRHSSGPTGGQKENRLAAAAARYGAAAFRASSSPCCSCALSGSCVRPSRYAASERAHSRRPCSAAPRRPWALPHSGRRATAASASSSAAWNWPSFACAAERLDSIAAASEGLGLGLRLGLGSGLGLGLGSRGG